MTGQTSRPCIKPRDPSHAFKRTDKQAIAFGQFVEAPYRHSAGSAYETLFAIDWALALNRTAQANPVR